MTIGVIYGKILRWNGKMSKAEFIEKLSSIYIDVLTCEPSDEDIDIEWDVYTQNRHDSLGFDGGYGWEHDDDNYMFAVKENLIQAELH